MDSHSIPAILDLYHFKNKVQNGPFRHQNEIYFLVYFTFFVDLNIVRPAVNDRTEKSLIEMVLPLGLKGDEPQ